VVAVVVVASLLGPVAGYQSADALAQDSIPPLFKNCTALHVKYPHGLGRAIAHDVTSGTPVTDFTRNTRLYNLAMHYNSRLDRDKDGIACEKA
jgi:hypothetical protein